MEAVKTSDLPTTWRDEDAEIVDFIKHRVRRFADDRALLERIWLECWALYLTTEEAQQFLRDTALETIGNVNVEWRHKLQGPKAFEAVEQLLSYFKQAMFPTERWLSVQPTRTGYAEVAPIMEQYLQHKIDDSNFYFQMDVWLRQLLITGYSIMHVGWCDDTDNAKYTTLSNFDVWFDSKAASLDKSPLVRRFTLMRHELIKKLDEGYYDGMTILEVMRVRSIDTQSTVDDSNNQMMRRFSGITADIEESNEGIHPTQRLEIFEYWGDIYLTNKTYINMCCTVVGDHLIKKESLGKDPKPFVIGTYIPVVPDHQPYPVGAIQPSVGLLVERDRVRNQRLDGIEIAIDPMYTVVADGVVRSDQFWTEPGKKIDVNSHDSVKALQPPNIMNMNITYQETGMMDGEIDRAFGTLPGVGSGQQRDAERVTRAEIEAQRDVGGTRITDRFKHIERHGLLKILKLTLLSFQENFTKYDIIRVAGEGAGVFNDVKITRELILYGYALRILGAAGILERKQKVQDIIDFVTLTTQIPQFAQRVNYDYLLEEVVKNYGFADPKSVLKQAQEAQAPGAAMPTDPMQDVMNQAQQAGGAGMQGAIQTQIAADGGQQMMKMLQDGFGNTGPSMDIAPPPEEAIPQVG